MQELYCATTATRTGTPLAAIPRIRRSHSASALVHMHLLSVGPSSKPRYRPVSEPCPLRDDLRESAPHPPQNPNDPGNHGGYDDPFPGCNAKCYA